jgi:hypothetical protein
MNQHPTPYPDINQTLGSLHEGASTILGTQLTGMYLYGSLSSGDFDPGSSDIDFVVITESELTQPTIDLLDKMHADLWNSGQKWASKLEGAYVPKDLIRRHKSNHRPMPIVNEQSFYTGQIGSDWIIQRHIIRECGICISGPDPKTLIDPVSADDIRSAVMGLLTEWWFPMLNTPEWLAQRGSEYHAYAIISMCRALHAMEHGIIVSKPAAAAWASNALGQPWNHVITRALKTQTENNEGLLAEALEFIQLTRDRTTSK